MKNEINALAQMIKASLFFLILFSLTRVFFLFYFGSDAIENSSEVLQAFLLGARYDLIVTSYLMVPSFLIWLGLNLLPSKGFYNFYIFILRVTFVLGAILYFTIIVCDLSFYSFFQDHINILFFGFFEDDTIAILESIWKNYPVVPMLAGVVGFLFLVVFFARRLILPIKRFVALKKRMKVLLIPVVLVLFAGAIRGGYGVFVLSPKYADFSDNEFINQLSRNSVMALEATYQLRQKRNALNFNLADELGYKKRIQDAFTDFLGIDLSHTPKNELINLLWRQTPENPKLDEKKPNVVVVLMESFGSYWLRYQSESFDILGDLKNHFDSDILFPHILPADNGTIGSLLGLTTNIPHRRGARFLSESRYLNMPLESGAHIPYKKRGYNTSFLYGGKLSWRNIGRYYRTQGYEVVEGENSIKKTLDANSKTGNEWGLYDEHLFKYALDKLASNQPQFMFILSTSNHPPFEVPENYEAKSLLIPAELESRVNREKELLKARFKAYQYANQKLAEFISKIKKEAPNTIIAVTGDHNFFSFLTYDVTEAYEKHMVPAYFYFPEELKPTSFNENKVASHEDIMTTVYNRSLSQTKYLSFGEDLFATENPVAINGTVVAAKEGVWYRNKYYSWGEGFKIKSNPTISKEASDRLSKRYRSTVTVADFYLRYLFNQTRADADKDQQE